MNYYIEKDNQILACEKSKKQLETTLSFMPQYQDLVILETEKEIVVFEDKFYFKEDIEEEIAQKERERIAQLYLTGADVERGIYQARGMDFEDIISFININPPQGLDIKALKIELKANNFYRGNTYVSAIGALLGFTEEQLDLFFETNDYMVLLPKEEPTEIPNEENNETVL